MNYFLKFGFVICLFLTGVGCNKINNETDLDAEIAKLGLETLPEVSHPIGNPSSAAKIELGKLLFWDPILSGEMDVACATCHHPKFGYGDGLDLPIGVGGKGLGPSRLEEAGGRINRVGRNAPSIVNTVFNGLLSKMQVYDPTQAPMFWDARMKSLESQAGGPPGSLNEMKGPKIPEGTHFDTIISRLKSISEYANRFMNVFGGIPETAITETNITKAIASFERTIVSKNSRYDQYLNGNKSALTEHEKSGLILFFGKANCGQCHSGPMFSDFDFKNLGIPENTKRGSKDSGLNNTYKFRTPTLRNIEHSAPYRHNGIDKTLLDVVKSYNLGKSRNPDVPNSDIDIKPLGLTDIEIAQIVQFLKTLSDENFDKTAPISVPSKLKVGGNI